MIATESRQVPPNCASSTLIGIRRRGSALLSDQSAALREIHFETDLGNVSPPGAPGLLIRGVGFPGPWKRIDP